MSPPVRTVRREHEAFVRELIGVREAADAVGEEGCREMARRTGAIHEFLAHRLMPHAVAEDVILFPALREESESAHTVAMTQCHRQIARLTDDLEQANARLSQGEESRDLDCELRRILYGVHALLAAHFDEAEDVFRQTLGRHLSASDREVLFRRLDGSAEEVAGFLRSGG
jgi:hemerythrin-like domain-containing protein